MATLKIESKKTIPVKKVFKTVGNGVNDWHEGKLYVPLSSIKKDKREEIVSAIQLGNSNKFKYTLDKKRRLKTFAPKNLLSK